MSLMKRIIVGLALMIVSSTYGKKHPPVVLTHSGTVRGFWQVSYRGRPFQSYEGIPYALPPVGELRFKSPEPIGSWIGEYPATKAGSPCTQYMHVYNDPANRVKGSEDCLFLNIYTPIEQCSLSNRNEKLLPVIFYIHSGAFQFGQGSDHQPHYLMDEDVIFVSINYRLGPLGFLSTGDSIVPGNMGLKDQNMALQWISDNIEVFGGDPKQVTLTGLSAGAASVHYHYLSTMSRGLFQRGMSLSGTALDCWTQTEASLEKAQKLGALMGCSMSTNQELVRCLRSRPAKSIHMVEGEFMGWLYNPFTPFGPVVEKNSSSSFINKPPVEIITNGEAADLPWITSVVSEEGLYPAAEFVANEDFMSELNDNFEKIAPHLLDYNYTISSSKHADVARKIRQHYLGNASIEKDTTRDLIHMIGDRLYVVDGEKAAKMQANASNSPIRFYYFSYRGAFSLTEKFTHTKENFGVSHADDNAYVFYDSFGHLTEANDLKMNKVLVKLWTSFATTGVPDVGVPWPAVDPSKDALHYLHIKGPDEFVIEKNTNLGEKKFWSTIDFHENKHNSNSASKRM